MRTITQQTADVQAAAKHARDLDALADIAYIEHGRLSSKSKAARIVADDAITQANNVLAAALAEVPTACRERIVMWAAVIARSSDDDEIRDAQAAQSELRWLLLQLEGGEG